MASGHFKSDDACREWLDKVSGVAQLFERRWTLSALRRTDEDLARRLHIQQEQFNRACLQGTVGDIVLQGAAMVRGWSAAIAAMEEAGADDDAYMLGADPVTGFKIAIGHQKAAAGRIVELYGSECVHITPDEIATLLVGNFSPVSCVKLIWPGAEVERYQGQGT